MNATKSSGPLLFVPPGTWEVDASRSSVGFEVRHLKLTKVRGRFRNVGGVIRSEDADSLSIAGVIDVASIDTGDSRRDTRLRDEDFFDAGRYPTITMNVTSPPVTNGHGFTVRGTMTIRATERPLELHLAAPPMPEGRDGDLRIRARGAVSRRAFGLRWDPAFAAGGLFIDDRVELSLDVVLARNGRGSPPTSDGSH